MTTVRRHADLSPDANDHQRVRHLLAEAARAPATVWAYAAAFRVPGATPVDQIVLMEKDHSDLVAFWARHPGSFTGERRLRCPRSSGQPPG